MRFTAAELTEIRSAFRQRLATERVPKKTPTRCSTRFSARGDGRTFLPITLFAMRFPTRPFLTA
jgi:hypothetical protein